MNPSRQQRFDTAQADGEARAMGKSDYQNNKKGWVTFKGGKKKMKLRAYLNWLVSDIVGFTEKPRLEVRETLIEYYNKDGVKGMHRAAEVFLKAEAK